MKTASLIQFNRIIFQPTFTLAPAARLLVPHCVSLSPPPPSPQCICDSFGCIFYGLALYHWWEGRVMGAKARWQ